MKKDWREKLIDLIEDEIECATGLRPQEQTDHESATCRMNDIIHYVEKLIIK